MKTPNFTLRPYQTDFIRELGISVLHNKRVIACAPTGSGKTKCFIQIAYNAIQKGRPVIIISDAIKIFDQIINEAGGTAIADGIKHVDILPNQLYIAMAQTLTRRPAIIEQFNLVEPKPIIIIDEAHIGTTSNIVRKLNENNDALLVGFTATPDARVAKHLPELYRDCIIACQVDDLIQSGNLCSYKHHARDKAGIDVLQLRNGEFTEASQNDAFNRQEVYEGLNEDLQRFKFKKAMIFVSSIKHCEELYSQLSEDGFSVTRYHSKLQNADYELAKFTKLDQANICISVGSLTKGFDYPDIDLVVLMRATTSLPLYLQMIGRGSRPTPTKYFFEVIDYGDNWKRHGLYWDNREWDKMWKQIKRNKKREGEGVAPITMCIECMAIIPAKQKACPYCNAQQPITEKELQQGELIEVTAHYNSLVGRNISELQPHELAIYAKIKSKQRFAARIAKAKEQQKPGFLPAFADAMGYKSGWVDIQLSQIGPAPIEFADIRLR